MLNSDKKKLIFTTLIVGAVCIFIVVIAAYSAQLRCENNDLIRANSTLQGEIDILSVKIKSNNNIEYIEKVAINKLGMVYPTASDCIYVTNDDKPGGNFASVIKEQAYN